MPTPPEKIVKVNNQDLSFHELSQSCNHDNFKTPHYLRCVIKTRQNTHSLSALMKNHISSLQRYKIIMVGCLEPCFPYQDDSTTSIMTEKKTMNVVIEETPSDGAAAEVAAAVVSAVLNDEVEREDNGSATMTTKDDNDNKHAVGVGVGAWFTTNLNFSV